MFPKLIRNYEKKNTWNISRLVKTRLQKKVFPSVIIKPHCDRVTKVGGRVMGATSCLDRAAAHWAALGCTRTYLQGCW